MPNMKTNVFVQLVCCKLDNHRSTLLDASSILHRNSLIQSLWRCIGNLLTLKTMSEWMSLSDVTKTGLGLDRTEAWTTPGQTKRIRRQYSGTKWCGLGNDASHYEDLGTKKELDMCCRDHDHCPVSVNGRTYNATLKLVNISKIPRSSCECEEKFYKCVKNAQKYTSDAALIGFVYFNILKMECIVQTHSKKCTQYFLWIFCIRWEEDRTIQTYRYISSYLRY